MAVATATHGAMQISGPGGFVEAVPTLDTSAYASGDLLFNPTAIAGAVSWDGGYGLLESLEVLDEDAQGAAFDLLVLDASTSLGTINNAFAASDALCRGIQAIVSVTSGDYVSLGSGSKRASIGQIGKIIQATAGTQSLWIAGVARSAPTHSAAGLRIRLGIIGA